MSSSSDRSIPDAKLAGAPAVVEEKGNEWESKIGNYELTTPDGKLETPTDSRARVEALLGGADSAGMRALHKGITPSTQNADARQRFLQKLKTVLEDTTNNVDLSGGDDRAAHPENYLTTLEQLLGEDGVALYQAAMDEEYNSEAFRNAVFLSSTKHYSGPRWTERMVLWVGGPSASGKSFATDSVVQKVGQDVMSHVPGSMDGNNVVSVDGGVEREVSQMRQMLLQVALKKGFAGVDDIDEEKKSATEKKRAKIKKNVEEAAKATDTLSIVIPCTFTSGLQAGSMNKFAGTPNVKQIFSKVVGGESEEEKARFKHSVNRMGETRAWSSKFGPEDTDNRKITMNNRNIGCESKAYKRKHFKSGKKLSAVARGIYLRAQAIHNKKSIYLTVTNDLIFVSKNKKGVWGESEEETPTADTIPTTARTLRAWEEYKKNESAASRKPKDFDEWIGYTAWKEYVKVEKSNSRTPMRFDKWIKTNKPELLQYSTALISTEVNEHASFKSTLHPNPDDPLCLGNALIIDIERGGDNQKNAIDSLFKIIAQMEPAAKAKFFTSLRQNIKIDPVLEPEKYHRYDNIIQTYQLLADAQANLADLKEELRLINKFRRKIPLGKVGKLNASIAEAEDEEERLKKIIGAESFKEALQLIQDQVNVPEHNDPIVWRNIIHDIPRDSLNDNNIFAQPLSIINSNRHEDIRRKMSRNLNHFRYVAPKGESGAQESGPQGGWYIGCYRTPDGKIGVQRFMIKRETKFRKNIIESLSGHLKSRLVNGRLEPRADNYHGENADYVASTFLVRDPKTRRVGANTYVASIAFENFDESHKLLKLKNRIKMAGTKSFLINGQARKLFKEILRLHTEQNYTGLDEGLIACWWTNDGDITSGNEGYTSRLRRFLNIDHAGGLIWLDPKIHPNRHGVWQNMKRSMRPFRYFWNKEKRTPEPTYHAPEYPEAIRISERMAASIKHYTNRMTLKDLYELIDEEIDDALYNFGEDRKEFKQFARRIGVPDAWLPKKAKVEDYAEASKVFLKEVMYARLINLRQYGDEITLSLCFEYDKKLGKFTISDHQKLAEFIRENPNYCLQSRHHFRGKSHGNRRSFLYHRFHNKYGIGSGGDLEKMLRAETKKVLSTTNRLGVDQFLGKDFETPMPTQIERAQNYIIRLTLIRQILINEGIYEDNPYKNKIKELIQYLLMYSSEVTQKADSRKQHLVKVCDDAYVNIQRIFEDLDQKDQISFKAKVQIFEVLHDLNTSSTDATPSLLNSYRALIKDLPKLHEIRSEEIAKRFEEPLKKQLETFSIENSEFTKVLKRGAESLDTWATETHDSDTASSLKKKSDLIEGGMIELADLSNPEELKTAREHIETTREKLQLVIAPVNQPKQQTYYTTTRTLREKPGVTYTEQALELLEHNTTTPHHTTAKAASYKAVLGDAVDEQTAVLLENPANKKGAGAVMFQENGITRIIDLEDPRVSFANLLARELRLYTAEPRPSEDELRIYIQEHYVDVIQSKLRPEMVTKENLYKFLIKPMADKKVFGFQVPGSSLSLFWKTESFSEKIYKEFKKSLAVQEPELIAWAYIWLKAFEGKKIDPTKIIVENSHGNAEFVRILLTVLRSRGAKIESINKTGYEFQISDAEASRMKSILEDRSNPIHPKVMQYVVDIERAKQNVEHAAALTTEVLPAVATALQGIKARLNQPIPDDIEELKIMRKKFEGDVDQIKNFQKQDPKDRHLQTYTSLLDQLASKFQQIDSEIEKHAHRNLLS